MPTIASFCKVSDVSFKITFFKLFLRKHHNHDFKSCRTLRGVSPRGISNLSQRPGRSSRLLLRHHLITYIKMELLSDQVWSSTHQIKLHYPMPGLAWTPKTNVMALTPFIKTAAAILFTAFMATQTTKPSSSPFLSLRNNQRPGIAPGVLFIFWLKTLHNFQREKFYSP